MQTQSLMKDNLHPLSGVPAAADLAQLQALMQRPAQNVNADGSFELGWGVAVLLGGLIPYLNATLPKTVWASWWTSWIGYVPFLCFAFSPYAIPKIIKRFITWPRTGYVANPNEVKLTQLILLMIMGGAIGLGLALAFFFVSDLREAIGRSDVHRQLPHFIWVGAKLLVCGIVAVYLGRKTISRRPALPTAYDAALIQQKLAQIPAGRKQLHAVKFTLLGMFVGIPILIGGVVLGLIFWYRIALPQVGISWPQLGVAGFLVVMNALLYLMANAVVIRQLWWKWLVLAFLLVAPVMLAPAIPYPAVNSGLSPTLVSLPPVMLCLGLAWFLSGAATLAWFIRRHPLPDLEDP